MKTKLRKIKSVIVLAICLLLGFSVFRFTDGFCLEVQPRNSTELPDYISDVSPSSNSELWGGCYANSLSARPFLLGARGINLKIDTNLVAQMLLSQTNHIITERFPKWVSLYVDGIKVDDSLKKYGCTCPAFLLNINGKQYPVDLDIRGVETFSWAIPLTIGNHIAKIKIAIPNVEPLEYEWHFWIR